MALNFVSLEAFIVGVNMEGFQSASEMDYEK